MHRDSVYPKLLRSTFVLGYRFLRSEPSLLYKPRVVAQRLPQPLMGKLMLFVVGGITAFLAPIVIKSAGSSEIFRDRIATFLHAMTSINEQAQVNDKSERGIPLVVVIGGGLAGVSAAIEVYESGGNVLLLEKTKNVGGNSAKATSGINGAGTSVQREKHIEDKVELFEADTLKSGGGRSRPHLVKEVVSNSADGVEWLMTERFNLSLTAISHCGGHSVARTHRIPPTADGRPVPVGFTTMKAVQTYLASRPERVKIETLSQAQELILSEQGDIVGVKYTRPKPPEEVGENRELSEKARELSADVTETVTVSAAAVVLTTGGYAYDRSEGSLLHTYAPDKAYLPTTSGPQATGDGLKLAMALGAHTVDMDQIQVHPTALVDPKDPANLTKFLGPESLRGEGGILVDGGGMRFVNELATRVVVTGAIFDRATVLPNAPEAGAVAYLIMNGQVADRFGRGMLGFYASKGFFRKGDDATSIANMIGCDPATLTATIESYGAAAAKGIDEFGKKVFPVKEWSPNEELFVGIITPAIHYTMGGVAIDEHGRVLKLNDAGTEVPIPGLYAAGEVTGGVHGANRLAGNSLMECVVMGREAGRRAAQYATRSNAAAKPTEGLASAI